MTHKGTVYLETPRLILRRFQKEDLEQIYYNCFGRCFGMHPDDELRQVELACEIGKNWWKQGLMTEATKKVIEFFFKEVGMNRVFAWHANENPASGKMQEKAGMKWEGTLRQGGKCNNGIFDKVIYAILAEDYLS